MDNCIVVPGYRTDHSGIILKLKLNENERGKSYWKFNSSLFKDREYVKIVKKTITEVLETYKTQATQQNNFDTRNNSNNNYNNNDTDNDTTNGNTNNEEYTINDQLLFEMVLLMIRGETINYSSKKKREKEKLHKQLEEEIVTLVKNMSEDPEKFNAGSSELLEEKKANITRDQTNCHWRCYDQIKV